MALALTPAVLAHESGQVVVEPPVARPGDDLSVHGSDLWTDAVVTIALVARDGDALPLGTAVTTGDGSLEMVALLPDDVAAGRYQVVVTDGAGDHAEVQLLVDAPQSVGPIAVVVPASSVGALAGGVAWWRRRRPTDDATSLESATEP